MIGKCWDTLYIWFIILFNRLLKKFNFRSSRILIDRYAPPEVFNDIFLFLKRGEIEKLLLINNLLYQLFHLYESTLPLRVFKKFLLCENGQVFMESTNGESFESNLRCHWLQRLTESCSLIRQQAWPHTMWSRSFVADCKSKKWDIAERLTRSPRDYFC